MTKNRPHGENKRQASLFDMLEEADKATSSNFEVKIPEKAVSEILKERTIKTVEQIDPPKSFRFISFGSGSSGNCAFIGTENGGVLIDAGIELKQVFDTLRENGITPEMVKGICLSHDHGDHVRYAYTYIRKYRHLNVYCTNRVMNGLLRRHNISRRIKEQHVAIYKEIPFDLAGMKITAFEVPHDGTDNAGFYIELNDLKFAVATDLGFVSDRAHHYLTKAHFLMLESNYDRDMLDNGTYPEYLKNRIRGVNGHLDNKDAAEFIRDNYNEDLKYVFLCHLSNDNNTPEIARNEFVSTLSENDISVGYGEETLEDKEKNIQIVALPRFEPSRWYVLRM